MEPIVQKTIMAAGLINALFFVFHLFFPRMFRWEKSLASLDRLNRAIFWTYHIIVLLILAAMAYISIRYASDLLGTPLGGAVLLTFAMFFILRIAAEFLYFGFDGVRSVIILAMCLVPAVVYMLGLGLRSSMLGGG